MNGHLIYKKKTHNTHTQEINPKLFLKKINQN